MDAITINPDVLPERSKYSLRLLQAKAKFFDTFKGMSKQKPQYTMLMLSHFPEMENQRKTIYQALNDQKVDYEILEKFERLVNDLPNS